MKKKFGNDYSCIAQIVCQDTVKAIGKKGFERKELSIPSHKCLESILSKSNVKYGYIDSKDLYEIIKYVLKEVTTFQHTT